MVLNKYKILYNIIQWKQTVFMADRKSLMRISHHRLATGYLEMEISMRCLKCGCENDIADTRCRLYHIWKAYGKKVKVKYNPDNPSEYVITSEWYEPYIPAIIALGVVIIYLIVLKINSNIRKSKESQVNNKLLSK